MAFVFKHGDRPLEGYTIQRGVGRGGFGEVYYAISGSWDEPSVESTDTDAFISSGELASCLAEGE